MTFKELGLNETILAAIEAEGYVTPTPIQSEAIPHILAKKDLLGCAQTGTGKTAAFALPIIQFLAGREDIRHNQNKKIRVLVLSPTRELAIQTRDNFRIYSVNSNLKTSVILGGVNQASQVEILRKGVDILIATPGRLLDLIKQNKVKLDAVETLVLDEADTMLDMGFIVDVKKIIGYIPTSRQTLMFSATMPKEIGALASTFLKNHITIQVNTASKPIEKINQSLYYVDKHNKTKLLTDILNHVDTKTTLVFTRTKHGANKLAETLLKSNIVCEVLHGNKSQNARVTALNNFKTGKSKVLIATDIAARGIDIVELSHVVNFEIPNVPETYVHRIGRTGRAGLGGTAISLCDVDEKPFIRDIQKLIKMDIPVVTDHLYPMTQFTLSPKAKPSGRPSIKKSQRFTSSFKKDKPRSDSRPSGGSARPSNGNFRGSSTTGKKDYRRSNFKKQD